MGKNIQRVRPAGVILGHGLWRHGLSFKALGLLYVLLDLSQLPDWEFSVEGLTVLSRQHGMGDGRDAIRSAIAELEAAQLLQRQQQRGEGGQLEASHWLVSDSPITASPSSGFPTSANRLQEGSSSIEEEKTQRPPKSPADQGPDFRDQVVALWNSQAPEHWIRIRELGQQRQRKLGGLVREFGSPAKALAALEASLRQARSEEWCMKASARLSLENWLSNGKVRQYQEKAAVAQQATSAALSGEQQEIAALAAQHPELIDGVLLEDGVLRLRYSERVQQQVGYPAMGMVNTVGALTAEISYLRERLAPACPF